MLQKDHKHQPASTFGPGYPLIQDHTLYKTKDWHYQHSHLSNIKGLYWNYKVIPHPPSPQSMLIYCVLFSYLTCSTAVNRAMEIYIYLAFHEFVLKCSVRVRMTYFLFFNQIQLSKKYIFNELEGQNGHMQNPDNTGPSLAREQQIPRFK